MTPVIRTLFEALQQQAQDQGDNIAIADTNQNISFSQWLNAAQNLSDQFFKLSLTRGDRVVLALSNSADHAIATFACMSAGLVFVPISPEMKAEKLQYILDDSQAKLLIIDQTSAEQAAKLNTKTIIGSFNIDPDQCTHWQKLSLDFSPTDSFRVERPISTDIACFIYTSGSTGLPKGVMQTHASIFFATQSISEYLVLKPHHRILMLLPLSFDYGLYQIFFSALIGCFTYIGKGFTFPQDVKKLIDEQSISVLPMVPTSFQLLNSLWSQQFPKLEVITSTGEDLLPETITRLTHACPNAQLFKMYGLTECKRVSYLPPEKIIEKPKSVGQAMPGTRAQVLNDQLTPLPANEIGTLHIQGAHIMAGYWNNPDATDKAIYRCPRTGERTLNTGDSFYMDEEGDLFFAGRQDHTLKIKGMRVAPDEIENNFLKHPDILSCAASVYKDPRMGSQLALFYTANHDINPALLRKFASQHLEPHLIPRKIIRLEVLPLTQSGKLDRRALRDSLE